MSTKSLEGEIDSSLKRKHQATERTERSKPDKSLREPLLREVKNMIMMGDVASGWDGSFGYLDQTKLCTPEFADQNQTFPCREGPGLEITCEVVEKGLLLQKLKDAKATSGRATYGYYQRMLSDWEVVVKICVNDELSGHQDVEFFDASHVFDMKVQHNPIDGKNMNTFVLKAEHAHL